MSFFVISKIKKNNWLLTDYFTIAQWITEYELAIIISYPTSGSGVTKEKNKQAGVE